MKERKVFRAFLIVVVISLGAAFALTSVHCDQSPDHGAIRIMLDDSYNLTVDQVTETKRGTDSSGDYVGYRATTKEGRTFLVMLRGGKIWMTIEE